MECDWARKSAVPQIDLILWKEGDFPFLWASHLPAKSLQSKLRLALGKQIWVLLVPGKLELKCFMNPGRAARNDYKKGPSFIWKSLYWWISTIQGVLTRFKNETCSYIYSNLDLDIVNLEGMWNDVFSPLQVVK